MNVKTYVIETDAAGREIVLGCMMSENTAAWLSDHLNTQAKRGVVGFRGSSFRAVSADDINSKNELRSRNQNERENNASKNQ